MNLELSGPWDLHQIGAYLTDNTFPLRLSCVGEDGFPRVVSVWFHFDGERFQCVSHESSQLVRLLRGDERVGFEVAPNEPPNEQPALGHDHRRHPRLRGSRVHAPGSAPAGVP